MSFKVNTIQISTITNAQSHQQHPLMHYPETAQIPQATLEHVEVSTVQQSPSILLSSSAMPSIPNINNIMNENVSTTHINAVANVDLMLENVMPGVYLTKNFISWKKEQLKAHCFTHIIVIDKHIQELYYPNQQPDIFKLCCTSNNAKTNSNDSGHVTSLNDDSSSINAFDDFYCETAKAAGATLSFGKEFEVIALNFGEKSYLTTVLPNCYRAVKFINKALQSGGTILVIDCNGGEQKCLTICVAYLMYKHNISFRNAFARLKEFYKKADLDRFYTSQLYEYEPILQVQRAQSRGHSCSRELHAAILKRKKPLDDEAEAGTSLLASHPTNAMHFKTSELLNNFNPLNRFDTTQMERHQETNIKNNNRNNTTSLLGNCNESSTNFSGFMSGATTGGWYNWDDYAME